MEEPHAAPPFPPCEITNKKNHIILTAEELTTILVNQLDDLPALPCVIPICIYSNQLDYEILRPEDQPARVEDHTALMNIVAENLRTEYSGQIRVELINIDSAAYLRHLHSTGQINNASTRAAFIATSQILTK